jgi:2-keto-4-pentenoate hydratase/2-oxohepta-3-ene-1,7-dioic acid hydratase in catechol pathway
MQSDGAATGPKGPRFRWRGHAARNLLLNLFCCQRTENWLYEGRAVETSSVHRCSSTLAAVDTTIDELDVHNLTMIARVNGEEWSRGSSSTMMWQVEEIIAYSSKGEGLQAGELIGSGTVGWGCGLELGKLLKPGDVVELEVEGIGVLRNRLGTPAPTGWMPQHRTPAAV